MAGKVKIQTGPKRKEPGKVISFLYMTRAAGSKESLFIIGTVVHETGRASCQSYDWEEKRSLAYIKRAVANLITADHALTRTSRN